MRTYLHSAMTNPDSSRKLICLADYEAVACPYGESHTNTKTGIKCGKGCLPESVIGYYSGGHGDEITLNRNRQSFNAMFIKPRVLRDVHTLNIQTQLVLNGGGGGGVGWVKGQTKGTQAALQLTMPVGIAPTAFQKLAHPMGEAATARAAQRSGVCLCLSTFSNTSMEEVAAANGSGVSQ
eukprot:GHVQ01020545.1.p2 GENE.GHVQ01020545.1~~GHVQ01020545.1.p2  ORF type:complete len:180 (-),score=35.44 GHVQ01020545.1:717-1256(-)